jgi:hypothetical protein
MDDRFAALRNATAASLLHGSGTTAEDLRLAVASGNPPPELMALVQKIHTRPYSVTDGDIESLKSLYTEDQLFEIIVAAAFGAARDRLTPALQALKDA